MTQLKEPSKNFKYLDSLDTLRGVAIVLVLLVHASHGMFKGGWIGVDLFFVLSGYLITSILIKEFEKTGTLSFSKFYARRALRLFPPLIVCIILANILWSFTTFNSAAPNRFIASFGALFYMTNILRIDVSGNMAHLWSLCVEEHFYFIWPILMFLFMAKRASRKQIGVVVLIMISLITVFKIFVYHFLDNKGYSIFELDSYRFTFTRMDCILTGALLPFVINRLEILKSMTRLKMRQEYYLTGILLLFAVVLTQIDEQNPFFKNGGFILTNLLCASLVIIASKNPKNYFFNNNALRWIGKRSYGIYLYHFPIFLVLEGLVDESSQTNFLLITALRVAVSIGVAVLSYTFVEQPIIRFKKRFEI